MDFIRGQNTPYWVWLWILKYDVGPFARRNGAPDRLIPIGANRPPRRPCNLNLGFWMFSVSPIFFYWYNTVLYCSSTFWKKIFKKICIRSLKFCLRLLFRSVLLNTSFSWRLKVPCKCFMKTSPAAFGVINPTDPLQMQDMARQVASADWS